MIVAQAFVAIGGPDQVRFAQERILCAVHSELEKSKAISSLNRVLEKLQDEYLPYRMMSHDDLLRIYVPHYLPKNTDLEKLYEATWQPVQAALECAFLDVIGVPLPSIWDIDFHPLGLTEKLDLNCELAPLWRAAQGLGV